jgi:hypothetical protein
MVWFYFHVLNKSWFFLKCAIFPLFVWVHWLVLIFKLIITWPARRLVKKRILGQMRSWIWPWLHLKRHLCLRLFNSHWFWARGWTHWFWPLRWRSFQFFYRRTSQILLDNHWFFSLMSSFRAHLPRIGSFWGYLPWHSGAFNALNLLNLILNINSFKFLTFKLH